MIATSNVESDAQEPTLDDMLKGMEAAMRLPFPIGFLLGEIVTVNRADRTVSIGKDITVSVDHPFLAGTQIHAAALDALDSRSTGKA
jgi:hypothetical protein